MLVHHRPAITSKHFGPAHFGLSWGMLSVSRPSLAFDNKADAKLYLVLFGVRLRGLLCKLCRSVTCQYPLSLTVPTLTTVLSLRLRGRVSGRASDQ